MMKFLRQFCGEIPLTPFLKGEQKECQKFAHSMNSEQAGFSLIELLVAITIGGVILTMVMTTYASMVQVNMKLDAARQLQKETNFAVIRMADKIRNFKIHSCEEKKLVLKDRNNKSIKFNSAIIAIDATNSRKTLKMDGQPLFSSNIEVQKISFVCAGVGENHAKLQPRVQIYLKVASRRNPEITNWIRTTISSRIFE